MSPISPERGPPPLPDAGAGGLVLRGITPRGDMRRRLSLFFVRAFRPTPSAGLAHPPRSNLGRWAGSPVPRLNSPSRFSTDCESLSRRNRLGPGASLEVLGGGDAAFSPIISRSVLGKAWTLWLGPSKRICPTWPRRLAVAPTPKGCSESRPSPPATRGPEASNSGARIG